MRDIDNNTLALLRKKEGMEPVMIVSVDWGKNRVYTNYSDRIANKEGDYGIRYGIIGRIISISNLENVVNVTGSGASQTLSIVIDDSDRAILDIINQKDVHKCNVIVWFWFDGTDINDHKFYMFEGEINSPMEWNEADATFSFDVVSKIEDREVGFSADEASFDYVPPSIIGKGWPLVFGTAIKVPGIRINDPPVGHNSDLIYLKDKSGNVVTNKLPVIKSNNNQNYEDARVMFQLAMNTARMYYGCAILLETEAAANGGGAPVAIFSVSSNPQLANGQAGIDASTTLALASRMRQEGDRYIELANKYLGTAYEITSSIASLDLAAGADKTNTTGSIEIVGAGTFPKGARIAVTTARGGEFEGVLQERTFIIQKSTAPSLAVNSVNVGVPIVYDSDVSVKYETNVGVNNLFYIPGGTVIRIAETTTYNIKYIAALDHVTIRAAWAEKGGVLTPIPAQYYTVNFETYTELKATIVTFHKPLSSIANDWSDDVYFDITSPLPTNVADVLIYLIQNYTDKGYDATSFQRLREASEKYPCSFAITERKNVFQVLQDIAFQARAAIWYKNQKFYVKYLPEKVDPVETITDADMDHRSLRITSTPTEELVTKLIFNYTIDHYQGAVKGILRSNIALYGTQEQSYDFYIYNNLESVIKSATFWLIRKSNTWKRIVFRTYIDFLRLETWDTVRLDLNPVVFGDNRIAGIFSNGPIDGIIENCVYDSENKDVELTVWLPIKWGSNTEYIFAMPADVNIPADTPAYPDRILRDTASATTGNKTNEGAAGKLIDQNQTLGPAGIGGAPPANPQFTFGKYFPDAFENPISNKYFSENPINPTNPNTSNADLSLKQFQVKDVKGQAIALEQGKTYPGKVINKINNRLYAVDVYFQGVTGDPTIVPVLQLQLADDAIIPRGAMVEVLYNLVPVSIGRVATFRPEYTMQLPVWQDSSLQEDDIGLTDQ